MDGIREQVFCQDRREGPVRVPLDNPAHGTFPALPQELHRLFRKQHLIVGENHVPGIRQHGKGKQPVRQQRDALPVHSPDPVGHEYHQVPFHQGGQVHRREEVKEDMQRRLVCYDGDPVLRICGQLLQVAAVPESHQEDR